MAKLGRAASGAAGGAGVGATIGGPYGAVAGGIIGGLGGLFGGGGDDGGDYLEEAMALYGTTEIPSIEDQRLILQKYIEQGSLSPEQAEAALVKINGVDSMNLDTAGKDAQMAALSQLSDIGNEGGLTASDKSKLQGIQNQEQTAARGAREAILQNAQARGAGGSGLEMLAQLQNAQEAATRQSTRDLDVAAMGQERALQALQAAGQLGGNINQQQFGQEKAVADSRNEIAKFNAANTQQVGLANTAANNAAQATNLQNKQNVANSNVDLSNQQQQYNKGLIQQNFNNKLNKASAVGNLAKNQANQSNLSNAADNNLFGAGLASLATTAKGLKSAAGGGYIPGDPLVEGDSELNDSVPVMVSPGEVVLPRSVANDPNAAADFVKSPPPVKDFNPSDLIDELTARRKKSVNSLYGDELSNEARDKISEKFNPTSADAGLAGLLSLAAGLQGKNAGEAGQNALNQNKIDKNDALKAFDEKRSGVLADYKTGISMRDDEKSQELLARESDPNSDESKLARSAALEMGVDPQIAEKITAAQFKAQGPLYQKIFEAKQKRFDRIEGREARGFERQAKLDEKMQGLQTPYGIANTVDDAKQLKSAHESKSNFDNKLNEMIALREKYGAEAWNREAVARGKQLSKDLLLEYKNMAKLGVLSQADENIINAIIPADPLEYKAASIAGQDPVMSNLKVFKNDSDKDFQTRIATRTRSGISDYAKGKGPKIDGGTRAQTKVVGGKTYQKVDGGWKLVPTSANAGGSTGGWDG